MKDLEKKTKQELIDMVVGLRKESKNVTDAFGVLLEKVEKLERQKKGYVGFLRDFIEQAGDFPEVLEGKEEEIDIEGMGIDKNPALTIAIKQILGVLGYKTSELSLESK